MGTTKVKTKRATKRAAKAVPNKRHSRMNKPYNAKQFEGTVPAFANVTMEEMRAWRDDR